MFAVEHVLADGCRRGDYEDVEFTFGLSFEVLDSVDHSVPAYGPPCTTTRPPMLPYMDM